MTATDRAKKKIAVVRDLQRAVKSGRMTIHAVAADLDVGVDTVQGWLDGRFLPSGLRVDRLADILVGAS